MTTQQHRAFWRIVLASRRRRNRYLSGAAAWVLVTCAALAAPTDVTALERLDAVTLDTGESGLFSAVIDPAGEFAYFGTSTEPGQVVKVDLETLERVGAVTLQTGEDVPLTAVIDPAGEFAYFGTFTEPGRVVKIDLGTFERVDSITLNAGESRLASAVIDPAGRFAYFATDDTDPGRVVKIDLETFERVDAITMGSGEEDLWAAAIDPAGDFAYFGTLTFFGDAERVVKIDLETFERVGSIALDVEEGGLASAAIDPAGDFAYFGTINGPGWVVKVDLETFEQVDAIQLEEGDDLLEAAVIDPVGRFLYFGTDGVPARVVAIDLETFERVDAITLDKGEDEIVSAVIDPARQLAYFGTLTEPGQVVQVLLQPLTPAALEIDFTSDGNGVLEPGEQVEMAPGWRNNDTEDVFGDGILSNFIGPEGGSYDIVTNGVGYGPVPSGEIGSCQDSEGSCYQLDVQMTGSERPARHWDAAVDEEVQIGPSEVAAHAWSLHIGDTFEDVPRSSPFYAAIEALVHSEATGGCTDSEYCPGSAITRAQMPVFMLRALLGADYTPPACVEGDEVFDDVPFDHAFCPWIQKLFDRGIVSGCGNDNYCPGNRVTRAQMAIFLLKTAEGAGYEPPECTNQFTDVPCPSLFADWIEDLAARGITSGCSENQYCPSGTVTRAQMAVFISRALGFTAYGP